MSHAPAVSHVRLSVMTLIVFLLPAQLTAQRAIRGSVVDDASLEPVPGALVEIPGTDIRTLTDDAGRFTLAGAPEGAVTLVVSRIGYRSLDVQVPANREQVTIRLYEELIELEELIVTGRAVRQAERLVATSVARLDGAELVETPTQSFDQSLQGKVAGVRIASNSGAPGGGFETRIRGTTTIRAQSNPLYIVDGVFVSDRALGNGQRSSGFRGTGNPGQDNPVNRVADINPNDIANIQVMKGGAATATYGSKAAGGVVIINTTRGSVGGPLFNLTTRAGVYDLRKKLDLREFRSAEEAAGAFGDVGAEEYTNSGGQVFDNQQAFSPRNDLSLELFGSLRGGSEDGLQYYASGNWKDDEGIQENTGLERQAARLNLTRDVADRGTINLNMYALHSKAERGLSGNGSSVGSLMTTPTFFDLRADADGVFPVNPFQVSNENPLQTQALMNVDEDVYRFMGSANFDYRLVSSGSNTLRLNGVVGADFFQQNNLIQSPPELFFEAADGLLGSVVRQGGTNENVNLGLNGVWEYSPGDFSSRLSIGAQFERRELDLTRELGQNLTGGNLSVDAGTQIQVSDTRELEEDFGFFVQEDVVALDERFSASVAVRFDQSATNTDNDKLFVFPQANALFRFPELTGFLDEVKIRTAFGQTGNLPQYGQEFTPLLLDRNFQGVPGFAIEGAVTNDLEPERQSEVEAGVDVVALGGRVDLDLTAFYSVTTNLILEQTLPPSTGFTRTFRNGGTLRSTGIEASLGLMPVSKRNFTWTTRTLFSIAGSEITELPVAPFVVQGFGCSLGCFLIEEGESPSRIVGSAGADLADLGDASPDFAMTFSHDLRVLEALRFYTLLEWRQGQEVINLSDFLLDGAGNSGDFLSEGEIRPVDECHPDCSGEERLAGFANGFTRGFVQPASFAKVREISISYSLPPGASGKIGFFDDVRLTLSGRDLITITNYRGMDPEVSNFGNQAVGRGIDVGPFPPSRSVWFGVDFRF